jgi:endonuclease-3
VDTHVWRVARRVGLIGPRVTPEAAHEVLRREVPPAWRHTLHVNLIRHGRQICHAQRPACDRCVLRSLCDWYWREVAAQA